MIFRKPPLIVRLSAVFLSPIFLVASPASAQEFPSASGSDGGSGQGDGGQEMGRTAETGAGEVGQRQTVWDAPNVQPMTRINNRVQLRVESRVNSRIDRNHDADMGTTSAFDVANIRARRASNTAQR